MYALYNNVINMDNLMEYNLDTILQGVGVLYMENARQLNGSFGPGGIPRQSYMVDKFLKRKI